MSIKKRLVKQDADTDEAPVGEGVNRWPESNPDGSLSPVSVRRSSSPSDRKGPRVVRPSAAGQRTLTTGLSRSPLRRGKEAKMAGRRQFGAQLGATMDDVEAGEEDKSSRTANLLWPCRKANAVGVGRWTIPTRLHPFADENDQEVIIRKLLPDRKSVV